MSQVNEQHLLDEIRFDIEQKDTIKARLVLSSLAEVSRSAQREALSEVSGADDRFVIPLLADVMVNCPDVAASFPQLKETYFSKVMNSPDVLIELLAADREGRLDKVFLGETAAQIRLKDAGPPLLKVLSEIEDPEAIERVILSLGGIGFPEAVGPVSDYLYSGHRRLVRAAVGALGEIATNEAVEKLGQRIGGDSEMDAMILDILARSESPRAVDILNDVLKSEDAKLRNAGKQRLGTVGITAVRVLARNLSTTDTDLIIHSLNVMGDIGDASAVGPIRELLNGHPKDANVRFAAYETLGRLPLGKNAYALAAGLEDPVGDVRVAAAKAIDRNYRAVLGAGIRNMLAVDDDAAMKIIAAIIDSECDNIFLGLLEAERFQDLALRYLSGKSHPDVQKHFRDLLYRNGETVLAEQIPDRGVSKTRRVPKVFAVDDSRMVLGIYRKVLHNLHCDAQVFEFPSGALERLATDIPDLVLTDLNMPEITGIDLTRRIRSRFKKDELPIIMVTTQSEGADTDAVEAAGVNGFVRKPFTEESIAKALSPFLGKLPK